MARPKDGDLDLLRRWHKRFEAEEARDLFYKTATFLIELALQPSPQLSMAESLAVLLQTWNRQYYRFPRTDRPLGFTQESLRDIEHLIDRHLDDVLPYRSRRLESVNSDDTDRIIPIFTTFEERLGRTGTAKTLHLLAPRYFPLWETKITQKAYHLHPRTPAATDYIRLMNTVAGEIESYGGWGAFSEDENPLKLIDEMYYCKFVRNIRAPN